MNDNNPQMMDAMSFNFNDIFLDTDKDEPLWDKLIQQIIDGNVIPVIGADMLIDNNVNPHQLLVDGIANMFRLTSHPHSFSELIYDPDYTKSNKKVDIYYQVNKFFAANRFPPSRRLQRLLNIRQFPFVITTSFTPIVEQTMQTIWGDELRVMRFNNNPSENHDIKSGADLRKPTVYYMFGKVGEGVQKYVLTDVDMLDFCSSWLSNDNRARPKNLFSELKDKYLLMLGNNYSDWLFRFRTIMFLISRQNGKTVLSEVIASFFLNVLCVSSVFGTSLSLDKAEEVWEAVVQDQQTIQELSEESGSFFLAAQC